MEGFTSMLMAADWSGWWLLKAGVAVTVSWITTTMKFIRIDWLFFQEAIVGIILILLSQGIGWPEERERDGGTAGRWNSQNTHFSIKFAVLYGRGSWRRLIWALFVAPQNNYNSNIKDYWQQITITSIIIIKKFEILRELPKCDTERRSEHVLEK
jgi:hypothetical protein